MWTAITKFQRLGGFNNRHSFSLRVPEGQDQGASMASSGENSLSVLQEAAILPCPHLAKRWSSLVTKTLILLYQGLTIMTSFTLFFFFPELNPVMILLASELQLHNLSEESLLCFLLRSAYRMRPKIYFFSGSTILEGKH